MNLQITLALRYLGGRKLRTVLTTLAITFGVMVIFGINSMIPAMVQAFQANAMAVAGQVDVSITSKTGEAFPASTLDKVTSISGVRVAAGLLERTIGLPANYFDKDPATPDRVVAVNLVGINPDSARTVEPFNIVDGRYLEASDANAAIISKSLADVAGVKVGDTLRLPTATGLADLTVVGLLPQQLLPGNERVFVNLPEAQNLMNMSGQINLIEANFNTTDPSQRQSIQKDIQDALGSSFALGVIQSGTELLSNIQFAQQLINVFGAMALLMGGFIIFNTFRTIVAERRHDIGMLRSVGASRGTITGLILVEGVIQGVLGTLSGLLLGYLIAQLFIKAMSSLIGKFMSLQLGGVPLDPVILLLSIFAGIGITLLASLLPARAASRVSPLDALRPATAEVARKRLGGWGFWIGLAFILLGAAALLTGNTGLIGLGGIIFAIGLILVAPALVEPIARFFGSLLAMLFAKDGTAQLAEGNLSRQPGRAAITASTTMIALTIVVMASSLFSSVSITFLDMLKKSLSSDYLIIPPTIATWGLDVGASPDLAQKLRAVNGVAVVSSLRFVTTQVNGVPVGMLGINPQDYQQTSGLTFQKGDPQAAYQALENSRGLIVNGLLSAKANIKPGDQVQVLTPTGEATYTVVGIASDYLNSKTVTGYISQANIAADFGRTEDIMLQMNLKPGADRAAVEAAMKDALKPYPQFTVFSGQQYIAENAAIFNSLFFGMVALVLFLSIPSLIAMVNTLAIGVMERRREIGMLRAVGATRRQVRVVILAEAMILSAIGTAFGVLAGIYLGYSGANAFGAVGFPMSYAFPASGVLLVIAAGLLFGAVAALIPARQAAGMQIVEALRYE